MLGSQGEELRIEEGKRVEVDMRVYGGTARQGPQLHLQTVSLFGPFWLALMPDAVIKKNGSSMNTDLFCGYYEFHHLLRRLKRKEGKKETTTAEFERKRE